MKIIINASTLSATGAVQVAISFIHECINYKENSYYVFLSNTIDSQIDRTAFPNNFKFYFFKHHPAYNFQGFKTRKLLKKLEREILPDCVFSIFGPSWWTPDVPHLMGYAYPYYVYPESPFFKILPLRKYLKIKLYSIIHRSLLRSNGKYYVCETKDVSDRLTRYINRDSNNIFTVTNTYNHYFDAFKSKNKPILPIREANEFRFVTLSSFSLHKNLSILNSLVPILKKKCPDVNVKFVLTVDPKKAIEKFTKETRKSIYNIGRIPASACPIVYSECDALFLPTLMECFSASYAEAMKMRKPILTSNLPFASTVCKDAALYFDPMDPNDIAEKIIIIVKGEKIRQELINKGNERLKDFDTASSRASKYLQICKKISKNNDL